MLRLTPLVKGSWQDLHYMRIFWRAVILKLSATFFVCRLFQLWAYGLVFMKRRVSKARKIPSSHSQCIVTTVTS